MNHDTDPWFLSQDGNFLHYKGLLYVPKNDWTSCTPTMTITWLDTQALKRQSRTSVVSYIGPKWSLSPPTTSICAQSAVAASPSITSPLVPTISFQLPNNLGTQSQWTSLRDCPSLM